MATVTFERATRLHPGSTTPAVDHLALAVEDNIGFALKIAKTPASDVPDRVLGATHARNPAAT
jgi:hypothetical protein